VADDGLVLARVAAHDERGVQVFELLDALAEVREQRLILLAGEIALAQAMVDIGDTQSQAVFFQRRAG